VLIAGVKFSGEPSEQYTRVLAAAGVAAMHTVAMLAASILVRSRPAVNFMNFSLTQPAF
jgi:hypothetical protein